MKGHLKILILISILTAGIIAQKMDLLDLTRAVTLWTVWPLLVLAGFSLAGILIRKMFFVRRRQAL